MRKCAEPEEQVFSRWCWRVHNSNFETRRYCLFQWERTVSVFALLQSWRTSWCALIGEPTKMQRMSLEPGLQPSELELEEENRKARIAVLQNVAAFGAIVVLLRIGGFIHWWDMVDSWKFNRELFIDYMQWMLQGCPAGAILVHANILY